MSDAVKEQLSAYLDGELAAQELDLLLKRLGRDPELRGALGRYALFREALRSERPAAASAGFAANVMSALENEPTPGGTARSQWRVSPAVVRSLRPVAGVAVAAGVAALAILAVQPDSNGDRRIPGSTPTGTPMIAANGSAPGEARLALQPEQPSYTVPANTSSTPFVPAARLTNYVVAHSEFSSPLGRRSVLSGVLAEGDLDADEPPRPSDGLVETQVTHP